jgi:hypothetical protein
MNGDPRNSLVVDGISNNGKHQNRLRAQSRAKHNPHEHSTSANQLISNMETHVLLHSKIWRHLRGEILQGRGLEHENLVHNAQEEIDVILHQYLKQFPSNDEVLHELLALSLKQRPRVRSN